MNAIIKLDRELIQFMEGFPWPLAMIDDDGQVVFYNEELKQTGVIVNQNQSRALGRLLPEYYASLQGEPRWLIPQQTDVVRQDKSGTIREKLWVRRLPRGAYLLVVDQTKLHKLEMGNAQTARLAALGFMLAGVCHEISNPLTAIHSMVQILRSGRGVSPESLEKGLDNIAGNVKRVLDVSRKLSDFSRSGDDRRLPIRVDIIVEEALAFARQDPWFIKVEVEHQSNPEAVVFCNLVELRQVFFNIFINALHAMQGKGRLSIRSSHTDKQVNVDIIDSGPGIAPEYLPRLFEPFFTTKPSGSGTGLGLAISNEIVLEHGGAIYAENTATKGACFSVQLPLHVGQK